MTARERLEALAWPEHDREVLGVLEVLVYDVERLQGEVKILRAQLSHVGYVQTGGEAS